MWVRRLLHRDQHHVDPCRSVEKQGALDKLEGFTSLHGPAFYRMEPNQDTITLTKGDPVTYPDHIATPQGDVTVFDPQMPLHWRVD